MKKVNIKGTIISSDLQWIYDWFGIEATSPKSVSEVLSQANGEDLEVEINSGGGDVFAGSEIYTTLKSYEGKVTAKIVGLAASAASVIAMAADRLLMTPTGQFMMHNVSTSSSGDYRDMEHTAEILKSANESIANAYMIKTGMAKEELYSMMDKETWMSADKALEKKFIDEIMFQNENTLVASYGSAQILPPEVINKIRNTFKSPLISEKNDTDILLQKAKLNLLKLKGDTENE